ncbi:hypothetical protein F5141DRAFT_1206012 [Pisolithus sp. B1]|nr:hypothetical protein F5141DRAFT_1206012 [Pisolithus sp. B1]
MAEKYQEILPNDLAVSKEVTEENRFGQGTSKLAWVWMMEGEQSQLSLQGGGLMEEFYRINWLKARATRDRWKEEVSLNGSGNTQYGMYKEARGNLELRNEILAEVKGKILEHEPLHSVELPQNLRVAILMEWLSQLDPEDQQDEIAIIQQILTLAFTGKNKEDVGEGEKAREEKARPTKAGDYKKAFTAFTAAQLVFKEEMDSYDRERWDTKDHKTIGQRTRIVQQWWESLSDDRKAEAGRAAEKWNKKNLPAMAKDFIETVQRTMGSHVVMFVGHESGEGQIKLAVFETAPGDGKKVFTESSQSSKDWVLTAESILTDYLLTNPVEEDSAEKQEVEISLDEDGNPEVPTWGGQKLKVQQNLARAVFQAAYAKFTKKPKAKVPWGLLIKSPLEYLDPESIPEGFMMKDPSKWTKADLGLLWDHWQFDRKVVGSSKKRVWVTVDYDSEAEVGGAGIPGPSVIQHSVGGPSEQTVDGGEVLGEATTDVGQSNPEEYQVLVDLVDALPEQARAWKGARGRLPLLGNLDMECQVLARGNPLGFGDFLKGNWRVAKCKVQFLFKGSGGGSGTWVSVKGV